MTPIYPTSKRAVSVEGDTVTKIQEPAASRRERLRTEAGRLVSQQTGLFVVPAIVSFDDSRGEIVFERLHLTEIRRVLSERSRSMEVVARAAEALAAIHGRMEAPGKPKDSGPDGAGIEPKQQRVPLHGDFGMRNVFCITGSDRLAVIDWANADWIGTEADVGLPEIDIAVFLISLFHRRVLGPWPVPRRHEVARHFLRTYESASPHGLDFDNLRTTVEATTPSFVQRTRRQKGNLRALGYRHSMIDLDFFMRRQSRRFTAGLPDTERG